MVIDSYVSLCFNGGDFKKKSLEGQTVPTIAYAAGKGKRKITPDQDVAP